MHPEALEFLGKNRICVLAIEMPDGSPHASTVHYAHGDGPILVFQSSRTYRKAEALSMRPKSRASISVGFSEGADSATLQMDGEAMLLDPSDPRIQSIYFAKFPEKVGKFGGPDEIFFVFTPTWWRFSDYRKPRGKTIFSSDQ
jgi:hypothetical protein